MLTHLSRHLKSHSKPLECKSCPRRFPFRADLQRHIISQHRVGNNEHSCPVDRCRSKFKRKDNLQKHLRKFHASTQQPAGSDDVMAGATTTASLPQNIGMSSAVDSFNRIYSVSMFMQAASSGDITILELLMNSGLSMETKADDGSTALHCAARNGQSKTVQYLLRKGASSNLWNKEYRSPLYEAFLSSDLDTVKVLMEQQPEIQSQYTTRRLEYYVAQTRNIKILELYAQHVKAKSGTFRANGIFSHAMKAKNNALAVALLDDPDFDVNGYNGTHAPMHDAARYGNEKMMELLLASDQIAKGSMTEKERRNALHIAASNGHVNVVAQLLRHDFDVESLDAGLRTPLHHAAMRGHLEIIKLLVDKWKADISCSDGDGHTPLHHAAFKGHWECAHALLEYIASETHQDIVHTQPSNMKFVKNDIIDRVLNSAAFENRDLRYMSSNNLLHCAVQNRDSEALGVFLSYDTIEVNAENKYGESPLLVAVQKRQIEAVRLLLQHPQIDIHQRCLWGPTALSLARGLMYQEIVDLLLSHGAIDNQEGDISKITTEASSSQTVRVGHIHNTPLQHEQEMDPEFDFGILVEGIPDLDDVSDAEDEMMGQEF